MLTIDIGNSRIKWARFQGDEIVSHNVLEYSAESLEAALNAVNFPPGEERLIVSYVAEKSLKNRLINVLNKNGFRDICFAETRAQQCGIINSYKSPDNMGVDRWLAMIAAFWHPLKKKNEAVCIIDCGTAITLDIVSSQGKHLGGLIMPGLKTMYESLIAKASRIQMDNRLEANILMDSPLASSTERAVNLGCRQLMLEGVLGIIRNQQQNIKGAMCCIVTGGDGQWVVQALEHIANYEPFLVHHGLRMVADEEFIMSNSIEKT